jgi:hypothetical protein
MSASVAINGSALRSVAVHRGGFPLHSPSILIKLPWLWGKTSLNPPLCSAEIALGPVRLGPDSVPTRVVRRYKKAGACARVTSDRTGALPYALPYGVPNSSAASTLGSYSSTAWPAAVCVEVQP